MSALDAPRWREISALLDELLDAPAHERAVLLESACADRSDLRREVESLLTEDASADTVLDSPLGELAAEAFADVADAADLADNETGAIAYAVGERVGAFRVVRELGRGGMGTVYLAVRADGQFGQQVAIKIVRGGGHGSEVWRRFEQEREILASLQHSHIARLLDGGSTAAGDPYFVMEYVAGEPITSFCDASAASIERRLALFLQVCEAVRFAHRNLVVHRDLKPTNILVGAELEVKLLDFGIAKVLEAGGSGALGSRDGARTRVMTPEYAAPEQIFGGTVTTTTDVFALGLLLCELVTGSAPRWQPPGVRVEGSAPQSWPPLASGMALAAQSAQAEPEIATRNGRRGPEEKRLPQRLRGDLDAIVATSLRVSPDERYPSVEALAEDVRRHLAGRPIAARSARRSYRLGKFLRRHRTAMAASGLALLAIAAGLVSSFHQAAAARHEARRSKAISDFLVDSLKGAWIDPDLADPGDMRVREMLAAGVARIEANSELDAGLRAELLQFLGDMDRMIAPELAQLPLEKALALRREIHGPRHELVGISLVSLGVLALNHRDWQVAERRLAEAVSILRARTSTDLPGAIARLGDARRALGRLDEAETLERESLALFTAAFGSGSPRLELPMSRLARVLVQRGDQDAAAATLRATLSLDVAGDTGGVRDLNTRLALAQVLRERGEGLDEARALYQWVEERASGSGPSVALQAAVARTGRALTLLDEDDVPAAKALFEDAPRFARFDMEDGLDYDSVPHLPIAVRRLLLDDPAGGAALLEQELVRLRVVLPAAHPRLAEALLLLGRARLERMDANGALAPLQEAVEARRRFFAPDSWRTAEAELALGVCLEQLGRGEEAASLLRHGFGTAAARHPGHSLVLAARKLQNP